MIYLLCRKFATLKPVPARKAFKRPPTDMKYVLSLKKKSEYDIEDEKWFPKRLQSFEENTKPIDKKLSSGLEKFEVDKTQKN